MSDKPGLRRELDFLGLLATGVCAMMGAGVNVVPFMLQRNVPGIGPWVLPSYLGLGGARGARGLQPRLSRLRDAPRRRELRLRHPKPESLPRVRRELLAVVRALDGDRRGVLRPRAVPARPRHRGVVHRPRHVPRVGAGAPRSAARVPLVLRRDQPAGREGLRAHARAAHVSDVRRRSRGDPLRLSLHARGLHRGGPGPGGRHHLAPARGSLRPSAVPGRLGAAVLELRRLRLGRTGRRRGEEPGAEPAHRDRGGAPRRGGVLLHLHGRGVPRGAVELRRGARDDDRPHRARASGLSPVPWVDRSDRGRRDDRARQRPPGDDPLRLATAVRLGGGRDRSRRAGGGERALPLAALGDRRQRRDGRRRASC